MTTNNKFGRNYRITIDVKDGGPMIVITMPFTIRFWMDRRALADLNSLSLDIYNLSKENRSRIFQDHYQYGVDPSIAADTPPGRTITVAMGYSNLFQVFKGTIQEASSNREGTDIVTRIEAQDTHYDIAASQTFQTLESGQSIAGILKTLIGQFPSLTLGAVGDFPEIMQRPVVLNGPTWDLLKKYSDNQVYIDNGKVYALKDAEVIGGAQYIISPQTGLLDSPRRSEGTLVATTILEPGIDMFSQVKLIDTITPAIYNGLYKVIGVRHEGIISAAVNGRAITQVTLLASGQLKPFTQINPQ